MIMVMVMVNDNDQVMMMMIRTDDSGGGGGRYFVCIHVRGDDGSMDDIGDDYRLLHHM